jgi:hypothetical protein
VAADDPLAGLAGPPVFVVGHPRSGTTWAFDVLEAHPGVVGAFETWMFHERYGLGSLFDDVHWDDQAPERLKSHTGRDYGLRVVVDRERLVRDVRAMAGGWFASLDGADARVIVEKTPVHVHAAPMINELFPEARFVEMVRDGRDVVVSTLAAARSWNPGLLRRREREHPLETAASEWAATVSSGRRLGEAIGDRWLRVRYEDLHGDFAATVSAMHRFCGLETSDELIERARQATDFGQYAAGEDRFRRSGRVGEWRERFSADDARRFAGAAGAALIENGYAEDASWRRELGESGLLRRLVPARARASSS